MPENEKIPNSERRQAQNLSARGGVMELDWQLVVLILGLIATAPIWLTILLVGLGLAALAVVSAFIVAKEEIGNICKGRKNERD